jgi:hypothetical protein
MLTEFHRCYPNGTLLSELIQIDHGYYIVRVLLKNSGETLVSALSSSNKLEEAEDQAIKRALSLLDLSKKNKSNDIAPLKEPEQPVILIEQKPSQKNIPTVEEPVIPIVNGSQPPQLPLETIAPIDSSQMIAMINLELKRIGWNTEKGREYLLSTYGKKSRHMLSDQELADFLEHLKSEPSASIEPY